MRGQEIPMRHLFLIASSLAALAAPGVASAACSPAFVGTGETVNLTGLSIGTGEVKREEFNLRVRNLDGGGPGTCNATIRVTRVGPADPNMPPYTLRSGGTDIDVLSFAGTAGSPNSDVLIPNAPPGPNGRAVPFQVTLPTPWGLKAGVYVEQLRFTLLDSSGNQADTQDVTINVTVPRAVSLRIVGATGSDEVSRIDLGNLSTSQASMSDPFALRIWSTSAYSVNFRSLNSGNLVRAGGDDRIPYTLTLDGQPVNLASTNNDYRYNDYTTALGQLHPLVVRAGPIGAVRAGFYSDRVFVTVTPV
ncbi:hypothetical protein GCM10023232_23470 [Sphingosinicella ginsenosidimutans]